MKQKYEYKMELNKYHIKTRYFVKSVYEFNFPVLCMHLFPFVTAELEFVIYECKISKCLIIRMYIYFQLKKKEKRIIN